MHDAYLCHWFVRVGAIIMLVHGLCFFRLFLMGTRRVKHKQCIQLNTKQGKEHPFVVYMQWPCLFCVCLPMQPSASLLMAVSTVATAQHQDSASVPKIGKD